MRKPDECDAGSVGDLSLVDRIFATFIDALAGTADCADIAERLKVTLMVDRDLSEAALDRALFDAQQP
ncbi:hypothetical protein [Methylobacterium sp. 37f]|uniref:hypothetical protein n=1 Tax=Methylobacterium sp. 37f TaxID=2817058 RepID=UPI000D4EA294|nr:hypothetical protein [Methylobacterium sp. 37f]MCK2056252.1 hypothetical protein [Methylobacterium sp. 37f]